MYTKKKETNYTQKHDSVQILLKRLSIIGHYYITTFELDSFDIQGNP